jgi:hypothetical protein
VLADTVLVDGRKEKIAVGVISLFGCFSSLFKQYEIKSRFIFFGFNLLKFISKLSCLVFTINLYIKFVINK